MNKIVLLGTIKVKVRPHPKEEAANVFCRIRYDRKRLSIVGVEGPLKNGDCLGSCGQIVDHLKFENIQVAEGWTTEMITTFLEIWERWHLNNTRAGCEHQRNEGWDKRPIDPTKPLSAYRKHFPGQHQDSWNILTWVTRDEHPEGLLAFPCSVCGYKYGTAWLFEEVPEKVLRFLESLPDTDIAPAWV